MGYIAKLRRLYDKWNAGEDAVYYLRRLLSYVLSKNPDCKKDVKKAFMKDVALHNEEIESILPYSAGLTAKQYRIMRNALSVMSAGTYQDDLIQSFLLHFKKVYFQPMKNLYYWEKVMATNVWLSFESLVCVVYYSLMNIEKIRSIQNVYKSLDFNNLKYFLFLLRVKQYLHVFDELIEDGVLEFAQREIEEGIYEKNASNRSINYADRLALETKTMPVLIGGEHLVNDYMLDLSVNSTEDEETVRELMRRLTIISIE